MIQTFCNSNITNVYTHCSTVKSVYTYGSLVWPVGPLPPCPPCEWYISWTPTSLNQQVRWDNISRISLSMYSGYFTDFRGVIPSRAFEVSRYSGANITYLETNAYSISDGVFIDPAIAYDYRLYSAAFYNCSKLTQASLSNCLYIGEGTFARCTQMISVYAPICEHVGSGAFDTCKNLSDVYLPVCTFIGGDAFGRCSLVSISLPECLYLGDPIPYSSATPTERGVFGYCPLESIYLPKCEYVGRYAFRACSSLSSVSLPVCSYISSNAFFNCSSLTGELTLPECKYIADEVFYSCNLSKVVLPKCSYIGYNAFKYNRNMSVIEIGYSGVCEIPDTHIFDVTPIKSGTGSIYVPNSLVYSYKQHSVWSYFESQIYPIP